MRFLAVVMLKKGDRIILPMGSETEEEEPIEFVVHHILYGEPKPGTVTLINEEGLEEPLSATLRVQVLELGDK